MASKSTQVPPVSEEFRAQFRNRYFVCYLEWRELLGELDDEQYRGVMDAAFEYAATGETPELTGLPRIVFLSIRKDMDRDFEHAVQRGWKRYHAELSRAGADYRNAPAFASAPTRTDARPRETHNTSTLNTSTHNTEHLTLNSNNTKQIISSSSRACPREDDDVTTDFDSLFLEISNSPDDLYKFHHSGYALDYDGMIVWLSDYFFNGEKSFDQVRELANQIQANNLRQRRLAKYLTVPNDKIDEKILTLYCQDKGFQIDIPKVLSRIPSIKAHWTRYADACAENAQREEELDF